MRRLLAVTAVGLALLVVAVSARADVDTEVPLPAKLQGSLDDGEFETIRFFAPEGATLTAKLSTKKKDSVDVRLVLLDPDDVALLLPPANVTDKGSTIKVKKFVLERSGTWSLRVSADGAGDYKLSVKTKLATSLEYDVELAGDPVDLTIPAVRGATLKITAKAPRGGTAAPVLQSLDGDDISLDGKRTAASHTATVVAPRSGDLVLAVAPDGGDGPVTVRVIVKPPKSKVAKVDVRGETLGRPGGGETAVGKVVQPDVGAQIVVGAGTDLVGAAINVPAGALTAPTLISIRSASPEVLADPDTGAGPTVEFLPSGLQFSQPVTVTVPIDVTSLPVQTTADDITVLVVESDGSSQEVIPTTVDLDAGVCTVPTSSFSRFTAIAPAGSPRLAGRKYWGVALDIRLELDLSGRNESGERHLARGDVLLDFDPDGVSVAAESVDYELRFGHIRNQSEQIEGLFETSVGGFADTVTWQYGPDGRHIELQIPGEQQDEHLFVSRDGSVLLNAVAEVSEGASDGAQLDLFLERPATLDPSALVVGTYYVGDLSIHFDQPQPADPLRFELLRTFGTVTFSANGAFTFDVVHVLADGVPSGSSPAFDFVEERDRGSGTWIVEQAGPFAGAIIVTIDGQQMRALPDRAGRVFVAAQLGAVFDDWTYLVGVKTSTGRSLSQLNGEYVAGTLFVEPREYEIEDGAPGSGQSLSLPDFSLSSESARLTFDGSAQAIYATQASVYLERNPLAVGGVVLDRSVESPAPLGVVLRKDGRFEVSVNDGAPRGAFTADGTFGFVVPDPDQRQFGLVFFVNRPRQRP